MTAAPAADIMLTPRRPLSEAALLLSIFEAPDPLTSTLEELNAWDADNRAADEALAGRHDLGDAPSPAHDLRAG